MKINQISFGQTYLKPSIKYMSEENRKKLEYSYALGDLYPVDIYLGATRKGDLTVEITKGSEYEYLLKNNEIPLTAENIAAYKFIRGAEMVYNRVYGPRYPVQKTVIEYLDYIPEDTLAHYIASDVEHYRKTNTILFEN